MAATPARDPHIQYAPRQAYNSKDARNNGNPYQLPLLRRVDIHLGGRFPDRTKLRRRLSGLLSADRPGRGR